MNALQVGVEAILGYRIAWGDTAAWVQAVGSIMAIWAAAKIAAHPQAIARAERTSALCAITALARETLNAAVVSAERAIEGSPASEAPFQMFKRVQAIIEAVPKLDVGSATLLDHLLIIEQDLEDAYDDLSAALTPSYPSEKREQGLAQLRARLENARAADAMATSHAMEAAQAARHWWR